MPYKPSWRLYVAKKRQPPKHHTFLVGHECWLIGEGGRWYRCRIVDRIPRGRVTVGVVLEPIDKRDVTREVDWPYGDTIEIRKPSAVWPRVRHISERSVQ